MRSSYGATFAFSIVESEGHLEVDYRPLVHELISALTTRPLDLPELSRRFHSTIVEIITAVCIRLSVHAKTRQVVLSGGVFVMSFFSSMLLTDYTRQDLKLTAINLYPLMMEGSL